MHQVEIATTRETLLDSPEMVLNMGPQHPSTHGVLRVILRLDGETVIDLDCDIGFLHRGMEKIAENRQYSMIAPYWDRLDYIAAVSNGLVWVETVEQMMGLDVPPRAHYLRTILTELNRIASHLLWLATHGLDIGSFTVLLWALREREEILKIFERQFGARLTCHAWRIGGMPNDAYDGFGKDVQQFVDNFPHRIEEYETLLSENRIWLGRTVGVGVISGDEAIAIGLSGPALRGSGVAWDIRKSRPYAAYADMDFDIPVGENGPPTYLHAFDCDRDCVCRDGGAGVHDERRQRGDDGCVRQFAGGASDRVVAPIQRIFWRGMLRGVGPALGVWIFDCCVFGRGRMGGVMS